MNTNNQENKDEEVEDLRENMAHQGRNAALANLRAKTDKSRDPKFEIEGFDENEVLVEDDALLGKYAEAFTDDDISDINKENNDEDIEELEQKAPPKQEKHRIKVNGVEREVTYEELVRKAQQVESADEYLRHAKASYDLAELEKARLSGKKDVAAAQVSEEEDLAEIANALQMGDKEEAINALRKLRNQAPSLSQDDVARAVDQKLSHQAAVEKFKADYSDIVSDPKFLNMVLAEDTRLISLGDTRSYSDRYTDLGNRARAFRDEVVTQYGSKQVENSLASKQQRKESAPQYPRKAAASAPTGDDNYEEGEPSAAERAASLSRKAKARGQIFTPGRNIH